MTQLVQFEDLGNMPYKQAWDYQESLLQWNLKVKSDLRVMAGSHEAVDESREPIADSTHYSPFSTHHYLLFVEHPPVYTLGKSGHIENILISEEERAAKGIPIVLKLMGY